MPPTETERIRKIFDKQAPKYDESMSRFERLLFAGNREWVCERAEGEVLELAAGTAGTSRSTGASKSPASSSAPRWPSWAAGVPRS